MVARPLLSPAAQRETLIDYLLLKVQQMDWHGVADAAMDLRELEAKHQEIRK